MFSRPQPKAAGREIDNNDPIGFNYNCFNIIDNELFLKRDGFKKNDSVIRLVDKVDTYYHQSKRLFYCQTYKYDKNKTKERYTVIIRATITLTDNQQIIRLFNSFADLDAWADRHRGHINSIEAKTILPGEIRQGKEK